MHFVLSSFLFSKCNNPKTVVLFSLPPPPRACLFVFPRVRACVPAIVPSRIVQVQCVRTTWKKRPWDHATYYEPATIIKGKRKTETEPATNHPFLLNRHQTPAFTPPPPFFESDDKRIFYSCFLNALMRKKDGETRTTHFHIAAQGWSGYLNAITLCYSPLPRSCKQFHLACVSGMGLRAISLTFYCRHSATILHDTHAFSFFFFYYYFLGWSLSEKGKREGESGEFLSVYFFSWTRTE